MRVSRLFIVVALFLSVGSCTVTLPKYATDDKVPLVKLGMTKEQVAQVLDIEPYYIKMITDTATILLYKYRVMERRTLSIAIQPKNGIETRGKFVTLLVTYNKNGFAKKIESCISCDETIIPKRRIPPEVWLPVLTITLPVKFVFL